MKDRRSLVPLARMLRKRSTDTERRVWKVLRAGQMGFKFRRQMPLCGFIVDFACLPAKVVVELDGGQHDTDEGKASDSARDAILEKAGFRVLRYWNHEVNSNLDEVLDQIYDTCEQRLSHSKTER